MTHNWIIRCKRHNFRKIAQFEIAQYLEKQSIEIDFSEGGIYRVWRDSQLLGTFNRDLANGLWISQPSNYKLTPRFESSNDAVMFIVEMNVLASA